MVYIRTGRPKTPILYKNDERFTIGGAKVLRESAKDRVTVVAAGVTVFEALKAHDELAKQGIAIRVVDLYSIVPIDRATLLACARATNNLISRSRTITRTVAWAMRCWPQSTPTA